MKERRQSERIKCRFRCELAVAGARPFDGTVVDVSSGGLAVRTDSDIVQQGDSARVQMEVPGRGPLEIEAIVWHVRRARRRDTGDIVHLLGMMIARAPDDYFKLARSTRPAATARRTDATKSAPATKAEAAACPRAAPRPPAAPAPQAKKPATPTVSELMPFRIRLKHRASPRTRVISVDAASSDEARSIAAAELGAEWEILESPNLMRS
jgi:hypothetical protein